MRTTDKQGGGGREAQNFDPQSKEICDEKRGAIFFSSVILADR